MAIELNSTMIRQTGARYLIKTYTILFCGIWMTARSLLRSCHIQQHVSPGNKSQCCQRHHHGVCHKVKEIQEIHSEDLQEIQNSVSHRGCTSEHKHDHSHNDAAFCPAPVKFIHKSGYAGFHKRNRTGQCSQKNKKENRIPAPVPTPIVAKPSAM